MLLMVGLVLSVAYWLLRGAEVATKTAIAGPTAGNGSLVNGFVIPLRYLPIARSSSAAEHLPVDSPCTLILAVADNCPACRRQAPHWSRLADELGLTNRDLVRVVSFDGEGLLEPFLDRLHSRGLPWILSLIEPGTGFGSYTGIVATPTIVLVDGTATVRFTTHELSDRSVRLLRSTVSHIHSLKPMSSNAEIIR